MHLYKTIILVFILSVQFTYAQDSTHFTSQRVEVNSPVVLAKDEFYSSPALRPYQRKYSYSILAADYFDSSNDLFLRQEGSGNKGLKGHSESYQKRAAGTTLWGEAYYINETIRKVNFNESLDYNLIYPYVIADSIGGDLKTETYYFSGGLAKKLEHFNYAFNASFKGVQAFRNVDPRPKNISSDVRLSLSLSKEISKKYIVSVDLNTQKYNQDNGLSFVNELGIPLVYHLSGLGVYNQLLAGKRTSAYYSGYQFGSQLNLAPTSDIGFAAQIGINRFILEKELSSIKDPIIAVSEDHYHVLIGYSEENDNYNYVLKLKAVYKKRNGTESKFAITGSNVSMAKISEDVRYINDRINISFETIYGRKSHYFDWYLGAEVAYLNDDEQYIEPNRSMNNANFYFGGQVGLVKHIKKSMITAKAKVMKLQQLNNSYSWNDQSKEQAIFGMLTSNYEYLSASRLNIEGGLRFDHTVSTKLNLFIEAQAVHTKFNTTQKGSQLLFTTGFIF